MSRVRVRSNPLRPYLTILCICFVCVLSIVSYGAYRCTRSDYVDPLTRSSLGGPWKEYIDGWGVLHFLFFLMLGYLYPRPHTLLFSWALGVAWEALEYSMPDRPFYMAHCKYKPQTSGGGGWWYGRWQDIVNNTLGLLAGCLLAHATRA